MTKQREMAKIVFDALDEKKGEDIKIIDISEISIMADYFVVASGSSSNLHPRFILILRHWRKTVLSGKTLQSQEPLRLLMMTLIW